MAKLHQIWSHWCPPIHIICSLRNVHSSFLNLMVSFSKQRWHQCDQIWCHFATLAKLYKSLAKFWWFISYLANCWAYSSEFGRLIGQFSLLQMGKYWKKSNNLVTLDGAKTKSFVRNISSLLSLSVKSTPWLSGLHGAEVQAGDGRNKLTSCHHKGPRVMQQEVYYLPVLFVGMGVVEGHLVMTWA